MLVHIFDIVFLRKSVGYALVQRGFVRFGVQDDGIGFLPVATGSPGFLKIGLYGVGQIHVDNNAHIRLVYAHSKGVGGYHDATFTGLPAVLSDVFRGIVQSGMVEIGCDVFIIQQFGDFFGTAAVAYIHNGAAGHTAQYMQQFCRFVLRFTDDIGKVVPLETHAEYIFPAEMQAGLDVLHDFRSCGSCQGQNRSVRQQFTYFRNFQVGGTEVVPPLRNAMAFVHRNHADLHFPQFDTEDFRIQPFGGDVEELIVAEDAVLEGCDNVLPIHAGVDGKRFDAPLP